MKPTKHSRPLLACTTLLAATLAAADDATIPARAEPPTPRPAVLDPQVFAPYVATFGRHDRELYPQHVPNAATWPWLRQNVPLFECPDKELE